MAARADKRYRIKRNANQPNQPPPAHQQQQQHAASSASCRPGTPEPGSPTDDADQQRHLREHLPWLMPSNASAAISLDLPEMSAENEASEGARFEHLVLPEAGLP